MSHYNRHQHDVLALLRKSYRLFSFDHSTHSWRSFNSRP